MVKGKRRLKSNQMLMKVTLEEVKNMIFYLVTFEELLVRLSETEIYRAARTIRQVKLTWQIIESLIVRQVRDHNFIKAAKLLVSPITLEVTVTTASKR